MNHRLAPPASVPIPGLADHAPGPADADGHGDGPAGWAARPLAALDLETTGLDPSSARIVELGYVEVDVDGEPTGPSVDLLVDPGVEVPPEAAEVHGLTTERVRAEGVGCDEALRRLAAALDPVVAEGRPLVVYNARFDWPLVRAEAARHGVEIPEPALLDPMVCDRALDRFRKGKRRVGDLADHYRVEQGEAHRAYDDALCAARITRRLIEAHPELAELDAATLHERQQGWFADWREGFNDYLHRKGADWRVEGGWPDGRAD